MNRNGCYPRRDTAMDVRYIKIICPVCRERMKQQVVLGECEYITILAHCGKRYRVRVQPTGQYEIEHVVG